MAELIAAGFPVPDGFCVATPAYAQAAAAAGLDDVLATPGPDLGARARAALLGSPVPGDVAAAVVAAYLDLGTDVPVAVRSSATAEDLPDASFAGEHDTFLWVVGEPAVLDAVRKCRESLNTDRAVAYRADHGIEHSQMAVVVQRMVRADAAGVAMTLNPANGDRCVVAIESAFGLGETVVGGTVTPDRFLVDKVMLEVVETELADKHVELVPGGELREVEPERRNAPSLTAEQVRAIAALAKRAEQHHGSPQDLEWAIEDGDVHLLQCRPITTLAEEFPVTWEDAEDAKLTWAREDAHFDRVFAPLSTEFITYGPDYGIRTRLGEIGFPSALGNAVFIASRLAGVVGVRLTAVTRAAVACSNATSSATK